MSRLTGKLFVALAAIAGGFVSQCAVASGPVTVLTNLAVTSNAMPNLPGWSIGGAILSVQPTTPPPVTGDAPYALEAQYPAVGAGGMGGPWANFTVPPNTESIYLDFWAKMPNGIGGLKWCKIFGKVNDPVGYANTTLGPMWGPNTTTVGEFMGVAFGDGSTTTNDQANGIRFTGNSNILGRSYGIATVLTPQMSYWPGSNWGTSWHHFRIHIKFNDGTSAANEVPDGVVYEEIDGKVYVDATGVYNRYYGNGPINYVGFFGWAQSDPQPFDVWLDNIVISTGGFVSDPEPSAVSASVN